MVSRFLVIFVALVSLGQLTFASENDDVGCTVTGLPDMSNLPTISKLPDPFKKLDGTRMTSKAEWPCRREELKKLLEKFVYGEKPPKPQTVTGTVSSTSVTVNVSHNGKSISFSASVSLPSGTGPFPFVVLYSGSGANAATIRAAGAATINYDPYGVGKERTGRANKQGHFYTIYGSNSQTGLLNAWGWGVSRIIDVVESNGGNILKPVAGVTGCSRFGKGSFVAGVFDQRINLVMPVESGTAGVPIVRGVPGEGAQSLSSAYGEEPWFGDAFGNFTSSPTRLPVDTHESVAYIAPRGALILDNPHIANLGPKSAAAAALAAQEVYRALGVTDRLSYWSDVSDGTHCSNRNEWNAPITANVQRFLLGRDVATGAIRMHSKATANKADWVDWTTPTLADGPGGGNSTTNGPTTTTTTSRSTTSTTTSRSTTTTTTSNPGGCSVAKYGQCGGNGYGGCTTCASGSTCNKLNDWYFQCL